MLGIIVGGESVDRAVVGDIAEVILAETALYAESGGQEADAGAIVGKGFDLEVLDVQKPVKGLVSHRVQVRSGEVGVGDAATSVVDPTWRHAAAQAHSATHLIHAALRQTLGEEAHQAGSYNKAGLHAARLQLEQAAVAARPAARSRTSRTTRSSTTSR